MNWNLRIDHNPRVLRCRAVHRRFRLDAAAGAGIVLGGSIPENRPDGHFYSPTVTTGADHGSEPSRTRCPGPSA